MFLVMPLYQAAFKNGECQEKNISTWRDCSFTLDQVVELVNKDKNLIAFNVVKNVITPNYASDIKPITPKLISSLLELNSISAKIIKTFGSGEDGYITSTDVNGENEVMGMLERCLVSIETLTDFNSNLQDGIAKETSSNFNPSTITDDLNIKGLSRLVTMVGSDILVRRDKDSKITAEKILKNLTNIFPQGSLHLNTMEVTAVINLLDSFPKYREKLFSNKKLTLDVWTDPKTRERYVEFDSFVNSIPAIMQQYFPVSYQSCDEIQFDRTCGLSFKQLFADMDTNKQGYIVESDIDMMFLIATAMEGVVNTCDFNSDNKLGWSLINGNDELDCAFSKLSHVTRRLIDAKIIDESTNELIKIALAFVDSNFITRTIGKSILVTGSLNKFLTWVPQYLFKRHATVGSLYALLAEVQNPEEAKRLQKQHNKNKKALKK
jgi:hypothetical protein